MTPAEQIAALYDEDSPRSFREDLEAHLLHGYVFAAPEYMLMARPVVSAADEEDIRDPWHVFPRHEQDCWLVYAFASARPGLGLVKTCLTHLPYALPLVAWERSRAQKIRFYQLDHENLRIFPARPHVPPAFLRRRLETEDPGIHSARHAGDASTAASSAPSAGSAKHVGERRCRGATQEGGPP